MIRFQCTSCGWPVRVAQVCAGRRGRCPSCGKVIQIPAAGAAGGIPDKPSQQTGGLTALAAAVKQPAEPKEDTSYPAPPPPVASEQTSEELALPDEPGNASERTEILPAERESPMEKHKREQERIAAEEKAPRVHAPAPAMKKPRDSGRMIRIIVLLAIVAVAAVALLAVALKVKRY